MRMYDLIVKKRNGYELTEAEIEFIITGYCAGEIPDYQMSAFLMAVYYEGMTDKELAVFTMAMAKSGDMIDLSQIEVFKVDKHSTGGVGDKTTFIVASIVVACGGKVAKMSGRGLGHTGGTIDKMESISGMSVELTEAGFIEQVNKVGMAVISQTNDIAPADKLLYALRDVTATIDSIPLIASSIMSKKIASGADGIVIDVKVGNGAFMKSIDDAVILAKKMVNIGIMNGRKILALVTNMDVPLGESIGNLNEMREVLTVLQGGGPKDLVEESIELAAHMMQMFKGVAIEECRDLAKQVLQKGEALTVFERFVKAQGGSITTLEQSPKCKCEAVVVAEQDGYIFEMNTEICGKVAVLLGAGRNVKDDTIDMNAGITVIKKTGAFVTRGEIIAKLYTNDESSLQKAKELYSKAIFIRSEKPVKKPTIIAIVDNKSVKYLN